jgi:hypothetical protein
MIFGMIHDNNILDFLYLFDIADTKNRLSIGKKFFLSSVCPELSIP